MKKRLKICHIITRMIVGGAQENTLLTLKAHANNGHEVVLITGPSPGPEGELLKKEEYPDFEIIETPLLVREISPMKDLKIYFYLKRLLREKMFDIVHTHSSKAGIVGRIAAKHANIPVVVHTIHGLPFHRNESFLKNYIYKMSEKIAARYCDKIYAVAQAMIDQALDAHIAPKSMFKVVYSGMDLEPYLTATPDITLQKKLNIPKDSLVVGVVARLFPLKGYEYFIPVAAQIAKSNPSIKFLVVGDGIMRNDLERQIKELGLENNFIFVGLIPPKEVYKYIALMTLLIHLSLREGLPRTVVQALAIGIPAVSYDLDGAPEVIINDKTGFVLPAKSIDEVATCAIKILSNQEYSKELGNNGRELVKDKFGWQKMGKVLEEEYYKILELKK